MRSECECEWILGFHPFHVATPYKGEAVFPLMQPGLGIEEEEEEGIPILIIIN